MAAGDRQFGFDDFHARATKCLGRSLDEPPDFGVGTEPCVGRRPATPHSAAGIRIEPPVSVPSATGAAPMATATAEPPLDPPASRAGSQGLPQPGVRQDHASSGTVVRPIAT